MSLPDPREHPVEEPVFGMERMERAVRAAVLEYGWALDPVEGDPATPEDAMRIALRAAAPILTADLSRAEEALRDLWADVGEMGRHYTTRGVEAKVLEALAHPKGENTDG